MTVAELIAALQKMPPNAPVYTEGCDCLGEAMSVTLEHGDVVHINRSRWP